MSVSYNLQEIHFEWDEAKAGNNFSKHKVSFETACEVFFDPFLISKDIEMVGSEPRETVVGAAENLRLIYVTYTIRGEKIRIISARFVTKQERNNYENQ